MKERAYELEELEGYLYGAGFSKVRQYGELKLRPPGEDEQRIFFAARKEMIEIHG